jgi:hypothetical protein
LSLQYLTILRLVYKPHSVQRIAPPVQSSLWAARLRTARCSLPGAGPSHSREGRIGRRATSHRPQTKSPLLGLAPGGGYLATRITARAGGLLHHLFTITASSRRMKTAVCFCGPFPAGSRLSAVSPPRVLSDAVLYRSADFPRSRQRRTATARPT